MCLGQLLAKGAHTHTHKMNIFATIQVTIVIPIMSKHGILESSVHRHALKAKQNTQITKSSSEGRIMEEENWEIRE